MKVSIVLPTYNQADMLPKAVQSVMAQTYGDWELIIVNDGSTDDTEKYLETLPKSEQFRIVHHDNNQKLPSALNTGFEFAHGDYYTWISSDSVCAPYMIQGLARALNQYPDDAGLAYADFFIIDENDYILSRISNPDYCFRSMVIRNDGNAAFMYPAKVAKKIGTYDTDLNGAEDWDYWLRIAEKYPFVYVPEALYYYKVHNKSMQQTIPKEVDQSIVKMYDKLFRRHNNQFQFTQLFPYLDMKSDLVYYALANFGSDMLTARIPQPMNATVFLKAAIEKDASGLVPWLNLSIAYAYLEQWDNVLVCIRELKNRGAGNPIMQYVEQIENAYFEKSIQKILKIPVIGFHNEQQQIVTEELKHKRHVAFTMD